jgi:hypothetical protein
MSGSLSRRGVLTSAAALAAATALPRFLHPSLVGRTSIGHVVVDERLPQSAAFAGGFDGPRLHAIDALDDLCNRWYTQLRREVLASSQPIAGLTTWIDYEIMRSCAAEIGYTNAFHVEHVPGRGFLEHRVTAHPDLLRLARTIATAADQRMVTWVFSPRSI